MQSQNAESPKVRYPSLRVALWLYLFVIIGTAMINALLGRNIEPLFLRFAVAMFVVAGFTFVAMQINRIKFMTLLGHRPSILPFILSLVIGLALFITAQWLSFPVYLFLDNAVGRLPQLIGSRSATQFTYLLQYGVIIPLCYGLLFWGMVQRGAMRTNRVLGAVLAAVFYAGYGLFATDLAVSSVPGWLIVGLFAAFIGYFTDSMLYPMAVISGFNLGLVLLQPPLISYLGSDLPNLISLKWLMAVIVATALAVILFQVIRVRFSAETTMPPAPAKRFWWAPLAITTLIFVFLIFSEMSLRSQGRVQTIPQSDQPASAAPIPPQ